MDPVKKEREVKVSQNKISVEKDKLPAEIGIDLENANITEDQKEEHEIFRKIDGYIFKRFWRLGKM